MWFGLGNARVAVVKCSSRLAPQKLRTFNEKHMLWKIRKMWDAHSKSFTFFLIARLAWTGTFCNILARSKCSAWNKGPIINCTWFPNKRKCYQFMFFRRHDFGSLTKIRIQTYRVSVATQCNTMQYASTSYRAAKDHEIAFVRETCV